MILYKVISNMEVIYIFNMEAVGRKEKIYKNWISRELK